MLITLHISLKVKIDEKAVIYNQKKNENLKIIKKLGIGRSKLKVIEATCVMSVTEMKKCF